MLPLRVIANLAVAVVLTSHGLSAQRPGSLRDLVASSQGRVIVTLKSDRPGAAVRLQGEPPVSLPEQANIRARLARDLGLQPRGTALAIAALFATVTDQQLAALVQDPNVELVEPDVLVTLADDRSMASIGEAWATRSETTPWGVGRVGAPQAWGAGNTGVGTRVGIIDSGIDNNHPDLSIGGGFDFVSGSSSPTAWNDNIAACNGHGTHVAGITAAMQNNQYVVGVAPGATVFALKVFEVVSGSCSSWSSNQIAAINWAITNRLDVVNLSLASSTGLTAYQNAIDAATAAGVVVVAATGNNGATTITFPARYNNVIAVAALDANDGRASFSNAGPEVWVAAPGVGIVSTMPGASTGSKSGTSMAAPHVAGLVALMRAANPSWTVARIRDEFRQGALDVEATGFDQQTGHGLARAPLSGGGGGGGTVSISVSPSARSVTVTAGGSAPSDNAAVTMTGGSASWVATKRKAWTTLTAAAGTGSGSVQWSRNPAGLAAGVYVDTIAVTAAGALGSPAVVYDTLRITAAPVPLTIQAAPGGRSTTVQAGGSAAGDSVTVTVAGTGSESVAWDVTNRATWLTLATRSGTGSRTVRWSRNAAGLSAGTYVDTIVVHAPTIAGARFVYDTLRVTAGAIALVVRVTPPSAMVGAVVGSPAPNGGGVVTVEGTGAASAAWTASRKKPWTVLVAASGTGNGQLSWQRNTAGLAAGTYVDTISVVLAGVAGASARIIDTLQVSSSSTSSPLIASLSPLSRTMTLVQGSEPTSDSLSLSVQGTGAAGVSWAAGNRKAWNRLTVAAGAGSGAVRWTRDAGSLAAGVYVDTISVSVAGLATIVAIDSTIVTAPAAPPVPTLVLKSTPPGRSQKIKKGFGQASVTALDSARVELQGQVNEQAVWLASSSASWITILTPSGVAPGALLWNRDHSALGTGIHVDSIVIVLASNPSIRTIIRDTVEVSEVTVPTPEKAAEDLFSGGRLDGGQREALDLVGNQNGRYDLGDFLAWVNRSGIRLSASLMDRVAAYTTTATEPPAKPSAGAPKSP
ncbi:MAG: S8 family serine peptidase [Gemmatimonadales bacterium]|nr:S8 family serine peptidase [Gemmatimonadales bacterium]